MWPAIIGIAVKAIGMGLNHMRASTIAKESFLDFVNAMQEERILPAEAKKVWRKQSEQMKEDEKKWK